MYSKSFFQAQIEIYRLNLKGKMLEGFVKNVNLVNYQSISIMVPINLNLKFQANYLCDVCKRTFARSDMLTR